MTDTTFDDDAITEPSSPTQQRPPAPTHIFAVAPLSWRSLEYGVLAMLAFAALALGIAGATDFVVDMWEYGVPLYGLWVVACGFVIGAAVGVVAGVCWGRR